MLILTDLQDEVVKLLNNSIEITDFSGKIPAYGGVPINQPWVYMVVDLPDSDLTTGAKTFGAQDTIIRVVAYDNEEAQNGYYRANQIAEQAEKILRQDGACIKLEGGAVSQVIPFNAQREFDKGEFMVIVDFKFDLDEGKP